MDEIYEYNGKKYTLAQLQEKYGDKVDDAISKFGFTKVEQESPSENTKETFTYKDKTFSRSQLEEKYGDKTDEAINKFGFESNLKKKESSESTSPSPELVSEAKGTDGISGTPQDEPNTITLSEEELDTSPNLVRAPKGINRTTEVLLEGNDSPSTVLMAHHGGYSPEDANGKHPAFPTLFPKDPNKQTSDPNDWIIAKNEDEAYEIAKERGEVLYFDTKEEAQQVAEGSWKKKDDKPNLVKDIDSGKLDGRIEQLQAENDASEKKQKEKETNYSVPKELFRSLQKGSARIGRNIAAIPELLYDVAAMPQNALADKSNLPLQLQFLSDLVGGEKLATDSEKFKDYVGVENSIKDYYSNKMEAITKEQEEKDKPIIGDITTNIKQGNIRDAFRMIGKSVSESLPSTVGIALSGGTATSGQVLTGVTTVFGADSNEEYKAENPEMNVNERVTKSLGKGLAEGVFSTIGSSKIGVAAKEILKKEGKEQGGKILKAQLVNMYTEALKKYSIPAAMLGEGIEEAATTMTQNAIDGKPIMEGVSDSFIVGSASGGGFGLALEGLKKVSKDKPSTTDIENVEATKDKADSIKSELTQQVQEGDLKPTEAKEIYDNWEEIKSNLQAVPEDYTTEEKAKAVGLIKQKKAIEKEIEGKDSALVEGKKAEIEEINNQLKNIKSTDAKSEKETTETQEHEVETTTPETKVESKKGELKGQRYTTKNGEIFNIEIYDSENGKVNSIKERKREDRLSLAVNNEQGKTIGRLGLWKKDNGTWFANIVDVDKGNQRKGIATAMYDFAESNGFNIVDSKEQTEAGKAFKDNRRQTKKNTIKGKNSEEFSLDIKNIEKDLNDSKDKGIVKVDVKNKSDEKIGKFTFFEDENGNYYASHAEVFEGYRKNGIATGVYNELKKQGLNIVAAEVQTEDGKKLWQKLNKENFTNETTPSKNTDVNGDVQPGVAPSVQQGKSNDIQETVEPSPSEGKVEVKVYKKGDGGTKGVFKGKDGKVYKSVTPLSKNIENGKVVYTELDKETQEHKFLSENQDMKHLPKVGKIVETSEGKAFEIEELEEVEPRSLTLDEIAEINKTLEELNKRNIAVNDNNTVMRRKNGEIVLIDLSNASENSFKDNESVSDNIVELLSPKDQAKYKAEKHSEHLVNQRELFDLPTKKEEHTYLLTQRPPSIGTHPLGQLKDAEEVKIGNRTAYRITYKEPLTDKELKKYELIEEMSEQDIGRTFEVGSSVYVIQNIDDGKITATQFFGNKQKDVEFTQKYFSNSVAKKTNQKTSSKNTAKPKKEVKPKPTVKRLKVPAVKNGEFDVEFDDKGFVTKVTSVKTGKEVQKIIEVPITKGKNKGKTYLKRDSNYQDIVAEATGTPTEQKFKEETEAKRAQALDKHNPSDEYGHALNYIARGGNVSLESAKRETKLSDKEVKWATKGKTGFSKDSELESIEAVAENIVANSKQDLDMQKLRDAFIDIISSNSNREDIQDAIVDEVNQEETAQQEEEARVILGSLSEQDFAKFEATKAEDDYISELTDSELEEYYNQKLDTYEKASQSIYGETTNKRGENTSKSNEGKSAKPKTAQERIKASDAKIDDIANAIKGIDSIFGVKIKIDNIDDITKNGIDMVDVVANIAKKAVAAGIHIDEAIQKTIAHLKKSIDFDVDIDKVKAKMQPKKNTPPKTQKTPKSNPKKKTKLTEESFRDKIKAIPESGVTKQYLSGETIKREHSKDETAQEFELRNKQDYEAVTLDNMSQHGFETIEQAKELYGDKYVEKTLKFLDNASLDAHEKAILYVALENEMHNRVSQNEDSVAEKKLQDLVRAKSQAHLRTASLAVNAGRLRARMKDGYTAEGVTNKMYSSEQLEGKKEIEKAIQSDMDAINNEAESLENEPDFEIKKPRTRRTKSVVKNEIKDVLKKMRADNLRAMKGGTLDSSLPFAKQLATATPHIIKLGKLLAELGGMKTSEIIDEIYNNIKPLFDKIKKRDISDVLKQANKPRVRKKQTTQELSQDEKEKKRISEIEKSIENLKKEKPKYAEGDKSIWSAKISELEAERKVLRKKRAAKKRLKTVNKGQQAKQLVKEALIEQGFSREITVTVNKKDQYGNIEKNSEGRNIKVKEKRTVLDWKKLAGEAGTVENIRENVEKVLRKKGYTDADISNMNNELEDEYNDLRAGVIEKSLNELNRRNQVKKKIDIKSTSKRLAELFNYGLFDKEADTYNNLINSALGFNDLDNKSFAELTELAKTLANLYNQDVSELGLQTSISYINKEIARTLSNASFLQSNTAYKLASITQEYINLSTRFLLHSLGQIIENPFSGYAQRIYSQIGYSLDKTDNKTLSKQRRKVSKERFKSIVRDGGSAYGDTSSLLINDSKVENWLNKSTNGEIQHSLISVYMGRAFLEGFDSRHKTVLTEKYFVHNLIKVLTHPSNPNKMSKNEALEFVTEKLTGQSFEDAKKKAIEITKNINDSANRTVLSTKDRAISIFAQDIMKDALLEGNMMTKEQLESSYSAAYKAAGKDIGHVSNNPASEMVGALNNKVERKLNDAIKEKDWNRAAYLTLKQIFTRNILNTFVGGGTNWIMLGLEKSGIYGLPLLAMNTLRKSNKKIDLTTTLGVKNLEEVLKKDMEYKNMATRAFIGSGLALIVGSMAVASGADDDINEWLKNNEWAKKYFNKLSPEILIAILSYKNSEMGDYFKHVFNAKSEFFDLSHGAARAVTDLVSDKENKGAEMGKFIGNKLNFPAPLRTRHDIKNIYHWVKGNDVIKRSYKASGFWNGYFMGGVIEELGLRPGENQEVKELEEQRIKIITSGNLTIDRLKKLQEINNRIDELE